MGRILVILFVVSLALNVVAIFIAFKALDYRKKMVLAWAQSHEWVSEYNKKVPRAAHDPENPSLVLLGASITANWDVKRYLPQKIIVNKGIDGQFSGQLLLRFKHDVIDLHPGGVVIKLCEMNFGHGIPVSITRDNLIMMATLAQANGIKPYIATVIPVSRSFDKKVDGKTLNETILEFNRWLADWAKENGYDLVDYAGAMSDEQGFLRADLTEDGVHPNDKGYEIMTRVLKETVYQDGKDENGD